MAAYALSFPAWAEPPKFAPPLDCDLGAACFIQQYVDADPGPGVTDFTCGPLSYDGHKGTDFALPSLAIMNDGVNVVAAASGTVRAVRPDIPDSSADVGGASTAGRECGNGVIIDHADGWSTQYCHLREMSITVAPDDRVTTGDVLGQVGLSGRTSFPHLHLTLRRDGEVVDPFNPEGARCGQSVDETLWNEPIPYRPGGIIEAGFADAIPRYDDIKAGTVSHDVLSTDADAAVFWIYAFGGRSGDELSFEIEGPDGPILTHTLSLDEHHAQFFRAIGQRRPRGGWPEGVIEATATFSRDGKRIGDAYRTIRID
ncbi:M23 family metallopeptidase [Palleronia sp. LCG004]|uniref:M23 family metallopeptidase n=1 Tax=Palleronia sp. LCG004 TaxID=3079304 RepID=UPI002941DFB7|nr:M23 family metallopeptidase [Palleronia sp. LCG004]WOI55080.1 M23 family metallopeptidase [Palleronia sp. LCG004]